jgi:hypothetical protein
MRNQISQLWFANFARADGVAAKKALVVRYAVPV